MSNPNFESYSPLGGVTVAITAASVEQTGLLPGAIYEFVANGGVALCRWDTAAATAADGGYTFVVPDGARIRVKNPGSNTLLNVIEGNAESAAGASLHISRVVPE